MPPGDLTVSSVPRTEEEEEKERLTFDPSIKLWESAVEEEEPVHATIIGTIPDCIQGTYLRVGPGKFDFETGESLNHWFDGFALISKFLIQGGPDPSVIFTSKFLNSESYKKAMVSQKPMTNEFGTKASAEMGKKGFFQKLCSVIMIPNMSDNCNYAFFTHGRDTFVLGETNSFHELDIRTLTSLQRHDTPKYFNFYMFSAHPLTDPLTGITYNLGGSVKTGLRINLLAIPPKVPGSSTKALFSQQSRILCSIPSRWKSVLSVNHSFGMSRNYIVVVEQPFVFNIGRFLGGGLFRNEPLSHWLEWYPDLKNRFYIIEKGTGKVLKTEILSSEPFFFLHVINCYEDPERGQIVIDISAYDDGRILDCQFLSKLRGGCCFFEESVSASIQRFVLPLLENPGKVPERSNLVHYPSSPDCRAWRDGKVITVSPQVLARKGLEMVTLNPRFHGLDYGFAYGASITGKGVFENCVAKINVKSREVTLWMADKNIIVGEVVFIPNAPVNNNNHGGGSAGGGYGTTASEDDGYLIVPSLDLREGFPDHIYILHAGTMKEVGRAKFNVRLPPALHGHFLPAAQSSHD